MLSHQLEQNRIDGEKTIIQVGFKKERNVTGFRFRTPAKLRGRNTISSSLLSTKSTPSTSSSAPGRARAVRRTPRSRSTRRRRTRKFHYRGDSSHLRIPTYGNFLCNIPSSYKSLSLCEISFLKVHAQDEDKSGVFQQGNQRAISHQSYQLLNKLSFAQRSPTNTNKSFTKFIFNH